MALWPRSHAQTPTRPHSLLKILTRCSSFRTRYLMLVPSFRTKKVLRHPPLYFWEHFQSPFFPSNTCGSNLLLLNLRKCCRMNNGRCFCEPGANQTITAPTVIVMTLKGNTTVLLLLWKHRSPQGTVSLSGNAAFELNPVHPSAHPPSVLLGALHDSYKLGLQTVILIFTSKTTKQNDSNDWDWATRKKKTFRSSSDLRVSTWLWLLTFVWIIR